VADPAGRRAAAIAAIEERCPRCDAARARDQEYCVECGMRLPRVTGAVPALRRGWLRRRVLRRFAEELIARYRIRTSSPLARIDSLSGGNVQRTVLARELSEDVRLLILQNPCFGLDAAAAAEIRNRIANARDRGVAVLLVSEDLDEVLELADRVVVMSGGRIVHEVDRAHADRYELGRHMARTSEAEAA